jgi:hypothetical protein
MLFRRKNLAWLIALGVIVGFGVLAVLTSGVAGAPVIAAVLMALYGGAALASVIDINANRMIEQSRSSLSSMRMSADAREASERARRRGGDSFSEVAMTDIGLIASQTSASGLDMRRSRAVSKDDDGVRPFLTLQVAPYAAERQVMIRFEMVDAHGEQQYVHEMRTYLRDGIMNILADHHLPLYGNDDAVQAGEWDLRVLLDDRLVGVYGFTVAPSVGERFGRSRRAAAPSADPVRRLADDDTPMNLEDLLRGNPTSNSQRNQDRRR